MALGEHVAKIGESTFGPRLVRAAALMEGQFLFLYDVRAVVLAGGELVRHPGAVLAAGHVPDELVLGEGVQRVVGAGGHLLHFNYAQGGQSGLLRAGPAALPQDPGGPAASHRPCLPARPALHRSPARALLKVLHPPRKRAQRVHQAGTRAHLLRGQRLLEADHIRLLQELPLREARGQGQIAGGRAAMVRAYQRGRQHADLRVPVRERQPAPGCAGWPVRVRPHPAG
jgi:hypothetical protein